MKKKVLSIILTAVLIAVALPLGAFTVSAETSGTCGDNLTWEYDTETKTFTISGTGDMWNYGYKEFYDRYTVTTAPWGTNLYTYNGGYSDSMEKVIISPGVTSIGEAAFCGCTEVNSVIIANTVTSIGNGAFYDCESLASIEIPNSVTSIGASAFCECTGLTSVTIPNSVTSISVFAFSECTGLTSITIPDSVTSIGDAAFYKCTGLESTTIGNGVKSIGPEAFDFCNALTRVNYTGTIAGWCNISFQETFPASNPLFFAHNLYINDEKITDLIIPDGVTSIGNYAFYGCAELTSITIPGSVTNIGIDAFYGCTGVANITIADGVTNINGRAFDSTAWYKNQPYGMVYAGKVAYEYKGMMPNNTNIVLRNDTVGISDSAFSGCTRLTSITIPNSVTSIGYCAFNGCTGLEKVFYNGTNKQKENIDFKYGNDYLLSAKWHYLYGNEHAKALAKIENMGETLRSVYMRTAIQTRPTAAPSDSTYDLRLISMIDCLDYSEIGFYITIDGYSDEPIKYSTDTAYTSFLNGGNRVYATDYGAQYFSMVTMTVPNEYYSSNITIQPYIIFNDGTEFQGNAINTTVSNYIK